MDGNISLEVAYKELMMENEWRKVRVLQLAQRVKDLEAQLANEPKSDVNNDA